MESKQDIYSMIKLIFFKHLLIMTLKDAKAYMISHPGVKFTCQVFDDEYIMYDERRKAFVFEDGYSPDICWWTYALSWKYDWWIVQ